MESGKAAARAAWIAEMDRRRKLALTYFHPRLHAPEAAALRREREVFWDRRLMVYLFPDRATLDRCRAACEALDAKSAADERARLEAAGYDLDAQPQTPPTARPRVFTLRLRRAFPVGATIGATPGRIAEGYPPFLRVLHVARVVLPHTELLGTRELQEVFVMTCEEAPPPAPTAPLAQDEAIDRLEDEA